MRDDKIIFEQTMFEHNLLQLLTDDIKESPQLYWCELMVGLLDPIYMNLELAKFGSVKPLLDLI